jgi:uncharacterized membrane protein
MKKISLLLVVLLAAGSAGLYGQMAIGTEFSVSGEATATLGYDLDTEQLGFSNSSEANISVELVAEQSSSVAGEGTGWVGTIELVDFAISLDAGEGEVDDGLVITDPSVTAKLVNGPLYLQISDAPGNEAGLIDAVENDEDGDNAAESDDGENDVHTDLGGSGITIGYTTDDFSVALGVSSEEEYGSDTEGSWAISADVAVNVGDADLELQVVQGIAAGGDTDDTGVAVKISTTFGDVTLSGGADINLAGDGADATYDIGLGADVALTDTTTFSSSMIYSSETDVGSDLEVTLSDEGGLVEGLELSLTWGLFDLANGDDDDAAEDTENDEMDMLLIGDISFDMSALGGTLSPGVEIAVNQIDGADATVGLTLKAVLTEAVAGAEIGLKWSTDVLFDAGDTDAETGVVELYTTIVY